MGDGLLTEDEIRDLRLLLDSIVMDSEDGRIHACGARLQTLEETCGGLWRDLPNRREEI